MDQALATSYVTLLGRHSIILYCYIAVGEVTSEIDFGNRLHYLFLLDIKKWMCYVSFAVKFNFSKLYMRARVDTKLINSTLLSPSGVWEHWISCKCNLMTPSRLLLRSQGHILKNKAKRNTLLNIQHIRKITNFLDYNPSRQTHIPPQNIKKILCFFLGPKAH